ncbi:MAG: LysM peptidoglycan-binding domain-containing protein [Alphaproteobacteria bacterium]|nr:LysM peptidoglycan-binding domain-containing protein [Alphaproteobacteria bacterium]
MDKRFSNMGKVKRTTEEIVEDAIVKQDRIVAMWHKNKPTTPAVSNPKQTEDEMKINTKQKPLQAAAPVAAEGSAPETKKAPAESKKSPVIVLGRGRGLKEYWFPILCAVCVIALFVWALIPSGGNDNKVVSDDPALPAETIDSTDSAEPTIRIIDEAVYPSFDVVRIEKDGNLMLAGRYLPGTPVSVVMNKKIVATSTTDNNGEFVYAPKKKMAPGNYTIRLSAADRGIYSENNVFVHIPSSKDYSRALSLLMTKDGSKVLQAPTLADGDLVVSKIDYLENGRIVVTGKSVPRLRVSLTLNGKYLGFSRTSDHRNFMLGANVDKLNAGEQYKLDIKLHDTSGTVVAAVSHKFEMPKMTDGDETYYTVRRGDALWIISRNFIGRGSLFTIIVESNNIKNPDLIYPQQKLKIPVKK